jgi:long-chain acyl-CoA synthetase
MFPYNTTFGTVVKAVLIKKPNCQELSLNEIRKYCKDCLAPYKIPKMIEYTNEIPRSHVGKVIRRKLKNNLLIF